ncbi:MULTISPECIES: DUF4149 domain-containing protein [unclassified Coleofasciculus]|uniref:DUF4149 domain-containing protein n=1 Tax=unclassified Coleofasciculus TaxID=2692782 RepID=UPI0018820915|nr:DUF4149 domain-containing protein [Coleofasciculus sp. LEGE 07092]MBE9126797.1 DUF4149 domain-containing protein [Coleofasciculus sp. LEGE 07081]MBE9150168.1 DUF4149 domain-containing protein [Coleofasciculus sp. LEGE 07092]
MNAVFGASRQRPAWQTLVMFSLGFWLSASLILDFAIMPALSAAGMMSQASFATAGYSIFWIFNRLEVVCAALVLVSLLALRGTSHLYHHVRRWSILLGTLLLAIALIYTYFMTPQMSALAMQLNVFEPPTGMPAGMIEMHEGYWLLEAMKFAAGATMLSWCYRDSRKLA